MRLFLIVILLIGINACDNSKRGQTNYKEVLLPGTRIYIEKPENYKITDIKDFGYCEIKSGETTIFIQDVHFIGGYNKHRKDKSNSKGYRDVKIGNYEGQFLYIANQGYTSENMILNFGDDEVDVRSEALLVGNFNRNEVKKILLSMRYDKDVIINPFEFSPVTINTSESDLKFAREDYQGYLIFTKNGIPQNEFPKESTYFVNHGETNKGSEELFKTELSILKKYYKLDVFEIKKTENQILNRYKCYEALITCELFENEKVKIKITCISNNNYGVITRAIVRDNDNSTAELKKIEKITNSIKIK